MSILPNLGFILSLNFSFTIFWPSLSENGSRSLLIPVASINYGNLNIGFKIPLFVWRNFAELFYNYIFDSNVLELGLCFLGFLVSIRTKDLELWYPKLKLSRVFLLVPWVLQLSTISLIFSVSWKVLVNLINFSILLLLHFFDL